AALERELELLPVVRGAGVDVGVARAFRELYEAASREAGKFKDEFISTEHFLLALLATDLGAASKVLKQAGVDYETVLKALSEVRGTQRVTDQAPGAKSQPLPRTPRAPPAPPRKARPAPVTAREEETRRSMQIPARRTKNNPVLVGEAGVGKTAIVE